MLSWLCIFHLAVCTTQGIRALSENKLRGLAHWSLVTPCHSFFISVSIFLHSPTSSILRISLDSAEAGPRQKIDGETVERVENFILQLFPNHCRWWLQPRNKKTLTPWKKSYDQPRQHIKKQRHYFANKGSSSQSYDFSSSHVWMWELDCKESWVSKWKWKWKLLSRVRLSVTPWTVAYQAPRSMEFSRQEDWSGLPFPSPISNE